MRRTARKSVARSKISTVFPCFRCGMIFAKNEDYMWHTRRAHERPESPKTFLCTECGRLLDSDEEFRQHIREHDVERLLTVLCDGGTSGKRNSAPVRPLATPVVDVQPQVVSTPTEPEPQPDLQSKAAAGRGRQKIPTQTLPVAGKKRADRTPSVEASARKKKRLSGGGSQTSSKPDWEFGDATTPTNHSDPQQSAPLPTPKSLQTLQSACPNCDQNLGKPGLNLVDHMIQCHEAKLVRLHKALLNPDGQTTSQTFADRRCPYCQVSADDIQSLLVHVIRSHRSRLFECPDNGECALTCELMCAIGAEATPKKFTISVKVKRRNGSN